MRARLAPILGFSLTALLTGALALAVYHREPTVRRDSWCPAPEDRASVTILPATEPVQVVLRLREIRRKAAALAPPALDLDSPPAPGSHAELDTLIRDLISDLQRQALEEAPL